MGLNINYFYSLTPREFYNISIGYKKKEERSMRLSWEQTRSIMYMINVSIPTKNKTKKDMQQFLPFPWDKEKEEEKAQITRKEAKDIFAKWDKIDFK